MTRSNSPPEQSERLDDFLQEVGYRYVIEDENAIRANFLSATDNS